LLGFLKPKLIGSLLQHIEDEERRGNAFSFFAAAEAVKEKDKELKTLLDKISALRDKVRTTAFTPDDLFNLLPSKLLGEDTIKKLANEFWQQIDGSDAEKEKLSRLTAKQKD